MKYRIVTAGRVFKIQRKFRFWPFWGMVFQAGFNHFINIEEAEAAIKRAAEPLSEGCTVKEFTTNSDGSVRDESVKP